MRTTRLAHVPKKMASLLKDYHNTSKHTLEDLLSFHVAFERIHPFQDGNGRVGRLLLFKECLREKIVPFILEDDLSWFYYRGLKEWDTEKGYLVETVRTAQDRFKEQIRYFGVHF